jgi:hypothetical protein
MTIDELIEKLQEFQGELDDAPRDVGILDTNGDILEIAGVRFHPMAGRVLIEVEEEEND